MIVLNYSHPLTDEQRAQLEALAGQPVEQVIAVPVQFDVAAPFGPQVAALVEATGLTADQWQTLPLLIVPPALNHIALALIAHLHGVMGFFPAIVRLRPVAGAIPPRFELAEIVNLQGIRETARTTRSGTGEE